MARFEVTYRAAGPWVGGSRVEALVTLPVRVPADISPEYRRQAAIEAAFPAWARVLAALDELAPAAELAVSVEAVRL